MTDWKPLNKEDIEYIRKLAPTCSVTSKNVGEIIHMSAKPTGGTAPYTVSFNKGTILLKQFTGVTEGQQVSYDYVVLSTDVGMTYSFSSSNIDSCSGGAKTCSEQCSIKINAIALTCKDIICALITGSGIFYQAYKNFIGREPDCGDADWLCNQGIDTGDKLSTYLSSGCTPNWQCELPLNGYEYDVNNCGIPRRLATRCNPIVTCGIPACNLVIT